MEPACFPSARPISLSDCSSLHLAQSFAFSFAERPGRPVSAIAGVYHAGVALADPAELRVYRARR